MKLSKKEQKYLLKLARTSISDALTNNHKTDNLVINIDQKLKQKLATFVTLTINDALRGCIGKILPVQELYKDIIENAKSSAFQDPRFPPLTKEEFENINIEISILTIPEKFKYSENQKLLKYLDENKPGVILSYEYNQATFLPQVWEELETPEDFLSHLCQKAGLSSDFWQNEKVEIQIYNVFNFSEND